MCDDPVNTASTCATGQGLSLAKAHLFEPLMFFAHIHEQTVRIAPSSLRILVHDVRAGGRLSIGNGHTSVAPSKRHCAWSEGILGCCTHLSLFRVGVIWFRGDIRFKVHGSAGSRAPNGVRPR